MEITRSGTAGAPLVKVAGSLDSHWAAHLTRALDEVLRDGAQRLDLDLAEITFLSSGGLRVLLSVHHRLQEIGGRLSVLNPSQAVRRILGLVGLDELLVAPAPAPASTQAPGGRAIETDHARVELFDLAAGAVLTCRLVGEPAPAGSYQAKDCRSVETPESLFGLGLGAFGNGFEDCRGRFGEFLAAGGAVACLPTDGGNTPDYVASAGNLVPQVQVLHGLFASGPFRCLARFEARPDAGVPLSELIRLGLAETGAGAAGFVLVAESAGLVGAALRRSPAATGASGSLFDFPKVREQLSFTPERAFARCQVVVAGIGASGDDPRLGGWLRPLAPGGPHGHFHAAAFTHRPLRRGPVELAATAQRLFESESLLGILHLLPDDRERLGAGESEFRGGACWFGPLGGVVRE